MSSPLTHVTVVPPDADGISESPQSSVHKASPVKQLPLCVNVPSGVVGNGQEHSVVVVVLVVVVEVVLVVVVVFVDVVVVVVVQIVGYLISPARYSYQCTST